MLVKYLKERPCRAFDKKGVATQFIPGINRIKESTWKSLLLNKNFRRDVAREYFQVVIEKEPEPMADGAEGSDLTLFETVRQAKPIIMETYDRKLLLSWRSRETRKTIVDEIDAQIARIDKRIKARSDDDGKRD